MSDSLPQQEASDEGDDVCLICLRIYNGNGQGQCDSGMLEHNQNVFNAVSKHLSSEIFEGCFQWNFLEEKSSPVCRSCYSSVEKIFKISEMLEKIQKIIQELINSFTCEVLGHHNRLRNLYTNYETNADAKVSEENSGPPCEPEIIIKNEDELFMSELEDIAITLPEVSEVSLHNEENDGEDIDAEDFDAISLHSNEQSNTSLSTQKLNKDFSAISNIDISVRYPGMKLKSLMVILDRLPLQTEIKKTIFRDSHRPKRRAALVASKSMKKIVEKDKGNHKTKIGRMLPPEKESDKDWVPVLENIEQNVLKDSEVPENEACDIKQNYVSYRLRPKRYFAVAKRYKCRYQTSKLCFNFKKDLKAHISDSGHVNKLLKCPKKNCTEHFFNKVDLTNHNTFQHYKTYYKCKTCLKVFIRKKMLWNHQRQSHPEKLFKCDNCEESFFRKLNLAQHKNIHSRKYFECKHCPSKFLWKLSLKIHVDTKHLVGRKNSYNCNFCSRSKFATRLHFVRHRSDHLKSKLKKIYPCAGCKKIHFVESIWDCCIVKHFRRKRHNGFICAICTSVFQTSKELDRHVIKTKHRNKKFFRCQTCGCGFYKGNSLRKHNYYGHGKRKWRKSKTIAKFECHICKQNFTNKKYLLEHVLWHEDPDKLKCKICGQQYKSFRVLRDHTGAHTKSGDKPYKCKICNEAFYRFHELKTHRGIYNRSRNKNNINQKNNTSKPFECKFCDETFQFECQLYTHQKVHTREDQFPCKICGKVMKKYYIKSHMLLHFKTPGKFKCDKCEKSFHGKYRLKMHEISVHKEERPFECTLCDAKFKLKKKLTIHMERHSYKANPILCEVCGKKFSHHDTLREHLRLHNGNLFKCTYDLCEKTFTKRAALNKHIKLVHTKELQYSCDVCHKILATQQSLKLHLTIHTGENPFPCNLCDKSFRVKIFLNRHVASAHSQNKIKCDICKKMFPNKAHLRLHTVNIHGEKKFQCEFCPYICKRRDYLTTHIKENHTQATERPFVCEKCGKGFKRKHVLDIHIKWHAKIDSAKNADNSDSQ